MGCVWSEDWWSTIATPSALAMPSQRGEAKEREEGRDKHWVGSVQNDHLPFATQPSVVEDTSLEQSEESWSPSSMQSTCLSSLLPADLGFLHGPEVGIINHVLFSVAAARQGCILLQHWRILLLSAWIILPDKTINNQLRQSSIGKHELWSLQTTRQLWPTGFNHEQHRGGQALISNRSRSLGEQHKIPEKHSLSNAGVRASSYSGCNFNAHKALCHQPNHGKEQWQFVSHLHQCKRGINTPQIYQIL